MLPRHGELRGGERYDRPSFAWVSAEEWQRRQWEREDRIFERQASQGQPCAPMVMSDGVGGVRGVQSQVDGRYYDSKASLRRHYRDSGVIEVGNEVPKTRFFHGSKPMEDPQAARKRREAIGRAMSRAGLPVS